METNRGGDQRGHDRIGPPRPGRNRPGHGHLGLWPSAQFRRRAVTAATAVTAALVLSSCASLGAGPNAAHLVQAASLTALDAADPTTFQQLTGGNEVIGETSLDLCYAHYPSEDLRVARNQVAIGDDEVFVSSEAILYASPESAEQAMDELRQNVENCPAGPVSGRGGDAMRWSFGDAPDKDWPDEPGIARQAFQVTISSLTEASWTSTATYLQRGRMILALYCSPPPAATSVIRNEPTPAHFADVMARRLAALPEDALRDHVDPIIEPKAGLSALQRASARSAGDDHLRHGEGQLQ